MKLLIDVNIFVDVLRKRRGWTKSLLAITRNKKHFRQKEITVVSPEKLLKILSP